MVKSKRNQNKPAGKGTGKEIDLHLSPGHGGADALERQLLRFVGELRGAISRGESEIIFIHGSGSGKLRDEIRRIITAEYPLCTCMDASFSRYGYGGATLVTIGKQNL